jgi:hypothetical protein
VVKTSYRAASSGRSCGGFPLADDIPPLARGFHLRDKNIIAEKGYCMLDLINQVVELNDRLNKELEDRDHAIQRLQTKLDMLSDLAFKRVGPDVLERDNILDAIRDVLAD